MCIIRALAVGRGGFALMMFNYFRKNTNKKAGSFYLTVMQLINLLPEKKQFSEGEAVHRISISIVAFLHVQDPNVKMFHL